MDRIKCVAVEHLPGSVSVAITQVGDSVYVYLSKGYDLEQIAAALEAASNVRQAMILDLRR